MSGIFSCIPKNDTNFAINIEDLSNSIYNKKNDYQSNKTFNKKRAIL